MRVRTLALVALTFITFVSWTYALNAFVAHREELTIQASEFFARAALPFRIARLVSKPADTELLVPIQGLSPDAIADTWGQARSGGRTHEGVDMFAPRGEPVYSATRGYVVRTGTNTLGGNIVFVIGPGGVRYYYAHLDRIAQGITEGVEVTTDTVLGFVGNTGNAESTAPHLHFGMYAGGAQNPYALLVERD